MMWNSTFKTEGVTFIPKRDFVKKYWSPELSETVNRELVLWSATQSNNKTPSTPFLFLRSFDEHIIS